ncbi:MAG: hypothetical protein Q8S44_06560 [Flavobacteriaceae bacterium]|nr:hypothetical protein [Flavobacteriaceae bacterium]
MNEINIVYFIKDVGVPVAAFIMMYALYVQNQKWQQKQTEKTEVRLDALMNLFISSIKEITDDNNKSLERHTVALERNTLKLEKQTTKLDEHIRLKDEFMEFIKDERRKHG